jgi:hypothetical protein
VERLDRSDFGFQEEKNAVPPFSAIPSSRPLNARPLDRSLERWLMGQAVGRSWRRRSRRCSRRPRALRSPTTSTASNRLASVASGSRTWYATNALGARRSTTAARCWVRSATIPGTTWQVGRRQDSGLPANSRTKAGWSRCAHGESSPASTPAAATLIIDANRTRCYGQRYPL